LSDYCAVISYKYLRKFAFDKMIQLEIPESVADFIEVRSNALLLKLHPQKGEPKTEKV